MMGNLQGGPVHFNFLFLKLAASFPYKAFFYLGFKWGRRVHLAFKNFPYKPIIYHKAMPMCFLKKTGKVSRLQMYQNKRTKTCPPCLEATCLLRKFKKEKKIKVNGFYLLLHMAGSNGKCREHIPT